MLWQQIEDLNLYCGLNLLIMDFFSQGFLLYQKTTRNSYLECKEGPGRPPSNMDRFERCLSIFKLHRVENRAALAPQDVTKGVEGEQSRQWRAVRVDLVVSPFSQFAFALLGWTGSKVSLSDGTDGASFMILLSADEMLSAAV